MLRLAQAGCLPPQLSAIDDARMLGSTKTQIDRRFRATGRVQTQVRSCWPRLVASTLMSPCVERQIVVTGRRSRTCATRSNSTPTRCRIVASQRRPAATLRTISCHSTPERSCRQRSCDRSVAAVAASRSQLLIISRPPVADRF